LGSRAALSNGNEPEEITALLCAFEVMNQVELKIGVSVVLRKGKPDLEFRATVTDASGASVEALPSASQTVIRWGSEYKSLMGAISSLLYAVDFQLAEAEWDRKKKPGA